MKYTIGNNVQEKTAKSGNQYKKFNVRDDKGIITENVTAFTSYTKYSQIVAGEEVEGVLEVKESAQYGKSFTLKDEGKTGGFAGGQKTKQEDIRKAQEHKDNSIMISSTARDATLILTSKGVKENWKEEWLKTRYWLVEQWNNLEQPKVGSTDVDYPHDISAEEIPF